MKCSEVQTWLMAAESPTSAPAAVERHLNRCTRCREYQRRLVRLEDAAGSLPVPAGDARVKRQFIAQLQQMPTAECDRVVPRRREQPMVASKQRLVLFVSAAAALLLVGLIGWRFVWLGTQPLSPETNQVAEDTTENSSDRGEVVPRSSPLPSLAHTSRNLDIEHLLLAKVLEHHLRLAETQVPGEQLMELGKLAGAIWQGAVQLVEQRPSKDLALLADLYTRIVNEGVTNRGRALPPEDRQRAVAVAKQLRETQAAAEQMSGRTMPAVANYLQRMGDAAGDAAQRLSTSDVTEPAVSETPAVSSPERIRRDGDLLETIVLQSLRLAAEDDLLERADSCNVVAEDLAHRIVLASASGDTEQAEALGEYLNEVLARGVESNLSRFDVTTADAERRDQYQRVKQRSQQAVSVLARNLQHAPKPARAGLERAMTAVQRGKGIDSGQEKGKSPRPGKSNSFVPPGLNRPEPTPDDEPHIPPGILKKKGKAADRG
jgi:hypothetical protein